MDITIETLTELLDNREDRLLERIQKLLTKPKSIRIGQHEAYEIYGRANVRAWRASGQLQPYKMIRRVEYEVAALDELLKQKQLIIKPKKGGKELGKGSQKK